MKSSMNTHQKFNIAIGTLAGVLAVLILITGWAVIMRVGNFLPNEVDVILLVPKEPSASVGDGTGAAWETSTDIDIFSARDENGNIVVSAAGDQVGDDKIIAPGTQGNYKFYVNNNGNVALDFDVTFKATLTADGVPVKIGDFPVQVRLSNHTGKYIAGSETEWLSLEEFGDTTDFGLVEGYTVDAGVVGKDSYYSYTLEWRWLYEGGNDELDTYFGTYAAEKDLVVALNIITYAEQSLDADATGGKLDSTLPQQTGGTFRIVAMSILIVAVIACGIALAIVIYKKKKLGKK
ncbi:MAG: hypothetical protein IJX55_02755 [Clostridia bacterium]|nr:hypothetical protein [Clostridia bacterium]